MRADSVMEGEMGVVDLVKLGLGDVAKIERVSIESRRRAGRDEVGGGRSGRGLCPWWGEAAALVDHRPGSLGPSEGFKALSDTCLLASQLVGDEKKLLLELQIGVDVVDVYELKSGPD